MDTYLGSRTRWPPTCCTSVKNNVFSMRARRHASTLEMALFAGTSRKQFYNLIDTFKKNLPTWHRYWAVRRKALGVDILQPYDIWAPLTGSRPTISYEQAVDMICGGLAPMGEDYVATVRRGCLEERWVDVMPSQGKMGGAFSSGAPGTYPFIMMSYTDEVFSLSTLAHELGHSMHSYLTWQNQPMLYSDYCMFVAEVASNFHQAMVRAHLLANETDPDFQIAVIEEAMSNFHRYFFIMPTLARFELEVHRARGARRGADRRRHDRADGRPVRRGLRRRGPRGSRADGHHLGHLRPPVRGLLRLPVRHRHLGRERAGAAHPAGKPGAVEDYLSFLKAGDAVYPLDALKWPVST